MEADHRSESIAALWNQFSFKFKMSSLNKQGKGPMLRLFLEKVPPTPAAAQMRKKGGNEVVIVKSGKRICGSGAALANAPIHQNKCYFELKIQSGGVWGVGIASRKCDLNKIPLGDSSESWVLRSDGTTAHAGVIRHRLKTCPVEGDMIACTYDHVELNFYHQGKHLHCPLTGMRGTVYPVFYVDDGAIIDVNFTDFVYQAPEGFEKIMFDRSLL